MGELETLEMGLSLTELAHRSIKRYILNGTIGPEDRLTEEFFAKQLGISKSPVREALNTLQGEGLLRIEPRRGTYLRRFTGKEIQDLYEMREALEVFAAGNARITPELVAELEGSVERTCSLLKDGDKSNYIDEDVRFHDLIVGSTDNAEMRQVFANIQNKLWLCRCQTFQLTSPDTPDSHRAICEAFREEDREAAAGAIRRHIRLVRDVLLSSLREQETEQATTESLSGGEEALVAEA